MTISTAAPIQVPVPTCQRASSENLSAAGPVAGDAEASPGAIAFAKTLGNRPRMRLRPVAKGACQQSHASSLAKQIRQHLHSWYRNALECQGIFQMLQLPKGADPL